MSDETKVVSKNKLNKKILISAMTIIAIVLVVVLVIFIPRAVEANKVTEQLSLGDKYLSELNYEQAEAAYLAVIEIDPKNVDAYLGLADVYLAQGEYDKAAEVLEDALEELEGENAEEVKDKLDEVEQHGQKEAASPTDAPTSTPAPTVANTPVTTATNTPVPTLPSTPTPIVELGITDHNLPSWADETTPESAFAYVIENNVVIITGLLDRELKQIWIPDKIEGYEVKKIGAMAFEDAEMTDLIISGNITDMEYSAFAYCRNLKNVILLEGITSIGNGAFVACTSLQNIKFPISLEQIEAAAFQGCKSLENIEIQPGITYIGVNAFGGCVNLREIRVDSHNSVYTSQDEFGNECNAIIRKDRRELVAACKTTIIPESVVKISEYAFYGHELENVTIPKSVVHIDENVFSDCYIETIIVDEDNPKYTSRNMLEEECNVIVESETGVLLAACLNSIIPDGITRIGEGVFEGNDKLTKVVLPKTIRSIGRFAFSKCNNLTEVILNNNIIEIESDAFDLTPWFEKISEEKDTVVINGSLMKSPVRGKVIVPDGVVYIGNMFNWCTELTSIVLPEGMTSIEQDAFAGCTGLTEVIIPESVTSIGNGAFFCCENLKNITIPRSVTEIGGSAFQGCKSLERAIIGEGMTELRGEMYMGLFMGAPNLVSVVVPESVVAIDMPFFLSFPNITIITPTGSYTETYALEYGIPVQNQ